MGQKVNPHGLRVGVIKDWDSKWYAEADFADFLVEDYNIRTYLKKKLYAAGVSKIEIERASDRVKVIIYTAKPGVVIGKGGAEIEKIKGEVQKFTDKKLVVDIKEVKRPDRDAQLVAENIALQLENRVSFRRAMKSCMGRTMKSGAKGIKTSCSGRLGGADMARTEFYSEGTIPLQTELILIMDSLRQIQPTVKLVLRFGSTKARYFRQELIRKEEYSNVNAKESKTS